MKKKMVLHSNATVQAHDSGGSGLSVAKIVVAY